MTTKIIFIEIFGECSLIVLSKESNSVLEREWGTLIEIDAPSCLQVVLMEKGTEQFTVSHFMYVCEVFYFSF